MLKIILQLILIGMIAMTIRDIKKGNLKFGIESYIISIIIYTILIMLLF